MRYRCTRCDRFHDGVPALSAAAPLYYYAVPGPERERRCHLDEETCIVDGEAFFARGSLEIPIIGETGCLSLGLWVSLSRTNFDRFRELLGESRRSTEGPFFGWLSANVKGFPDCQNLKTLLHLRDDGLRPFIELEPTDHPLAVAQRSGLTVEATGQLLAEYVHHGSAG